MKTDPTTSLTSALESFASAWMGGMGALTGGGAAGGDPVDLATRLLDPRHWLGPGGAALEQPFETILGLPRLADVPAIDRKVLALMQGWLAVAQRTTEYSALASKVWLSAYTDFIGDLQRAAQEGNPVRSGRELLDRWAKVVNDRLLTAQRSDEFLAAQGRLLDAMLVSRAREQEIVEVTAQAAGMPTRSEVDDVHRTLHDVKRELRALQRQLSDMRDRARDRDGGAVKSAARSDDGKGRQGKGGAEPKAAKAERDGDGQAAARNETPAEDSTRKKA